MIHLFYIESYFHLLVVDQIIHTKQLPLDDCRFITERGTRLPEHYQGRLLYDGSKTGLKERINLYYHGNLDWNNYNKQEICAYLPFQFFFPSHRYFAKYCFFEEGFSAYSPRVITKESKRSRRGLFKGVFVDLLLPYAKNNAKGLIAGVSCDTIRPLNTTLYRLSDDAYKGLEGNKFLSLETLGVNYRNPFSKSEIKKSVVVVADRISSKGRPFDDGTYLDALHVAMEKVQVAGRALYVKLHPADFKNEDAKQKVRQTLSSYNPIFITENLENLAVCNNGNLFVGTNSTALYYAPILGDTNESVSFARLLAAKDAQYRAFLQGWGGTEKFCELFGKKVKCL